MSAYQEEKNSISKTKGVGIPMSTILYQLPIKHNILSKKQPIRKRKVTVVTKEEVPFKKMKFDNWLGKYNNYKSNDNKYFLLIHKLNNN